MLSNDLDLSLLLDSLGISADLLARTRLPFYPVAPDVVLAETDADGTQYMLAPDAARAWRDLKSAAREVGIHVEIVSSFRTIEDQAAIIREKLARDMPIDTILTLSAPPGYSEHHTGRAVDINTPGCAPREESFEQTDAFRWLVR
ncbi:MAG: M15 family metallopeptidase, partial [Noviherbaspirillum sp.]